MRKMIAVSAQTWEAIAKMAEENNGLSMGKMVALLVKHELIRQPAIDAVPNPTNQKDE